MDTNVPPTNTLLVVNELIKANKDFDLLMLPNRGHGFGNEGYMVRRRWGYFVKHLLGAEPPHEYQMHAPAGLQGIAQELSRKTRKYTTGTGRARPNAVS